MSREHTVNPVTDRCVACGRNRFNREVVPQCTYEPKPVAEVLNYTPDHLQEFRDDAEIWGEGDGK